jgi:hypothetical protein
MRSEDGRTGLDCPLSEAEELVSNYLLSHLGHGRVPYFGRVPVEMSGASTIEMTDSKSTRPYQLSITSIHIRVIDHHGIDTTIPQATLAECHYNAHAALARATGEGLQTAR